MSHKFHLFHLHRRGNEFWINQRYQIMSDFFVISGNWILLMIFKLQQTGTVYVWWGFSFSSFTFLWCFQFSRFEWETSDQNSTWWCCTWYIRMEISEGILLDLSLSLSLYFQLLFQRKTDYLWLSKWFSLVVSEILWDLFEDSFLLYAPLISFYEVKSLDALNFNDTDFEF